MTMISLSSYVHFYERTIKYYHATIYTQYGARTGLIAD